MSTLDTFHYLISNSTDQAQPNSKRSPDWLSILAITTFTLAISLVCLTYLGSRCRRTPSDQVLEAVETGELGVEFENQGTLTTEGQQPFDPLLPSKSTEDRRSDFLERSLA